VVSAYAKRFGGDFMLTSQGDKEQIYSGVGTAAQKLSLLKRSGSVDDSMAVDQLRSDLGAIIPLKVAGAPVVPQGMLFMP
jgi:hypothetical protein